MKQKTHIKERNLNKHTSPTSHTFSAISPQKFDELQKVNEMDLTEEGKYILTYF